jgi:phosphoribosylaminoimidazole-succinocarboxamide synthase
MESRLSPARLAFPILEGPGLKLVGRGKVRDTYLLKDHGLYLSVATDAVSIFDFTLNAMIPWKGAILNALSHFFLQKFEEYGVPTHLVAAGSDIDQFLPANLRNQGNWDLWSRAVVVKRLEMIPVEFIAREYLTGSGLKAYNKDQSVCGHWLPPGLQDGDRLPYILDTPTTKAEAGHDVHLDADTIRQEYPQAIYLLLKAFQIASSHALQHGIVIADTKLEFGHDSDRQLVLADEAFTPDSSRFYKEIEWRDLQLLAHRKAPTPYDKQLVRNWGLKLKIDERDPESDDDLAWVHNQSIPESLTQATTQTYKYIFWLLTGMTIGAYCRNVFNVSPPDHGKNVAIIVGSNSDLKPDIAAAIQTARTLYCRDGQLGQINVHVVSCHRNTPELIDLARNQRPEVDLDHTDVIIAGAGMAAQLPGVLDALLFHAGRQIPVIGLAFGEDGTEEFQAARLSIKCLPSQPVLIDEMTGRAYANAEGLSAILERLATGEFPPPKQRKEKTPQFNLQI